MILLCNKPNIKTVKNHNARKGEYLSQHFSRATHEKGRNNNKCCRRHLFVDVLKNKKKLSLKKVILQCKVLILFYLIIVINTIRLLLANVV